MTNNTNTDILTPDLLTQYLRILGITARKPSYEALEEITNANITRIPFESVSKLYYRKTIGLHGNPGLKRYLAGVENYHFGGTCYSNNCYLHLLLKELGYDVMLCGADMNDPDVHIVNIVKLQGREYIVDGGYAAPFVKPLPRDLDSDYTITQGNDSYILKPQDSEGRSRMEHHRDGKQIHGYIAKPLPRTIDHFSEVIADSYSDHSTFMNALVLVRIYQEHSIRISNLNFVRYNEHGSTVQKLADRDALIEKAHEYSGIPRDILSIAVGEIGDMGEMRI